jgi:hypothetical protein
LRRGHTRTHTSVAGVHDAVDVDGSK